MGNFMLVKWLQVLCFYISFCVRSLIFGGRNVLGFASAEFKFMQPHVFAADSTLTLCVCFCVLWDTTFYHIPCLQHGGRTLPELRPRRDLVRPHFTGSFKKKILPNLRAFETAEKNSHCKKKNHLSFFEKLKTKFFDSFVLSRCFPM